MYPAFAHFRRTATRDTEIAGQPDQGGREGGHVVRLARTATRTSTRTPTASTSTATPSTRPSAPAAATSASAPPSPGSSCTILFEETLKRFPQMELAGKPEPGPLALPQPAEDAARELVRPAIAQTGSRVARSASSPE